MIKQQFSKEQKWLGGILKGLPMSPNQITLLSILFALIAGGLIIFHQFVYGAIFFLVAGVMDVIDGAVARAKDQTTKFGGFLDGVSDRFVEAIFLFSLMFYDLPTVFINPQVWLAGLIFIGTCMPSFVRAYGEHKHVIDHNTANKLGGIFERSERIITIFLGIVIGFFISWQWFIYIIILSIILSLITVIQRIYIIYKETKTT